MDDSSSTVTPHTHLSNKRVIDLIFWSTRALLHQTFMSVLYRPNLNSRVHVIVDVIIFQHTMAIVIEVDPNLWKHTLWLYCFFVSFNYSHLFLIADGVSSLQSYLLPAVYPVPSQDWCATCCHPHSCQCVAVHLVLFYDALPFLVLQNTKPLYITAVFSSLSSVLWNSITI